ncbi:MAG: hypothetical protein ABR555_00525 [Pyrinomonadaceae bacterium]
MWQTESLSISGLNYYNYFTEIEDAFVRRRGKHLFISNLDWALIETWKDREIPLHIVLRAIEKAFDSYEARPRKRSVKSLFYCQEEVEAQFTEWLESRVGAANTESLASPPDSTRFSADAIAHYLKQSRTTLAQATQSCAGKNDELTEALDRALTLLSEIEQDFTNNGTQDTRKLEDSLTGLERMLNDAILTTTEQSHLKQITKEISKQLQPYRQQMEPTAYDQTLNKLLLKRLREDFAVPRLSLFYL